MKPLNVVIGILRFWPLLGILLFGPLACQENKGDKNPVSKNMEVQSVEVEPDDHFHGALDAFSQGDYHKSAELIKKGIEHMKTIAELVDSSHRTAINNSIAELYDLESDVWEDKVDGIDELNRCFARAGKAIAGVHMIVTQTSFYALDGKKAGVELLKAIGEIERLENDYRSGIDKADLKYLEEVKLFAVKVAAGSVEKEELDRTLKELSERRLKSELEVSIKANDVSKSEKQLVPKK